MDDESFNKGISNIPLFSYFNGGLVNNYQRNSLEHDSYHVYVNDDFVGDKVLIGQNEGVSDVTSYLINQGFQNFSANLDGNHFNIYSDEANKLKRTLSVYLNNR